MKKFTKKAVVAFVSLGLYSIIAFGSGGPQVHSVHPIAVVADDPAGNGGPSGH